MKALSIAVGLAIAASVTGFVQGSANAASPLEAVSIDFTVTTFTPTTFSGIWQATGAITDSGTFVRTDVNFTGSLENSPTVGTFQSELLLTSSSGTFTVQEQLMFTLSGVSGLWEIGAGTGAYNRVSGHGSFEFISVLHFIDSGVVSKTG